jgi:amidase
LERWHALLGHAIGPEDVEPSTWAAASEGRQYSAVQLQAAYQRIVAGAGQIPAWWAAGCDLLVTPTLAQLPPPIDLSPDAVRGTFGMLTLPYNFTGQPAISLPLAWSRSGLPIGVQLVAAYGQEALLFRVAAQLMAVQPWEHRWPTLPD